MSQENHRTVSCVCMKGDITISNPDRTHLRLVVLRIVHIISHISAKWTVSALLLNKNLKQWTMFSSTDDMNDVNAPLENYKFGVVLLIIVTNSEVYSFYKTKTCCLLFFTAKCYCNWIHCTSKKQTTVKLVMALSEVLLLITTAVLVLTCGDESTPCLSLAWRFRSDALPKR